MRERKRDRDEVIAMGLITKRALSPYEFINLSEKERLGIKSTRILPPRLGKKRRALGKIEVTYDTPYYAM
jgi:hypothetical protein